ncbi:DNA circularization protein [Pandoraea sp. SD6-2]|uniref:DNA circularization protein n=1 Tax=Pandoraea sp. SD6-2 TaxID=1286093 RepID=UPI00032E780F|nr:DNA circularization N-terminal domain-containing protein [Pandoraea sp. SD6-2]EON13091.1 DNA circulation family protein [Pandoraea sp. SD6-2]
MAWKDTLLDASFRGVAFDVQRTSDGIEKDTAHYASPYVDGEDIRDLGLKAHDVSLTAIIFGDDYERRMKALLDALTVKGAGELIHPVFGSLPNMQFMTAHVSHDAENVDACQIEMHFKRATPGNPFFIDRQASQIADAATSKAAAAQQAGASMFDKAVGALKMAKAGLRRLNAFRNVMNKTLGAIKSFVADVKQTALDFLTFPGAFASDLMGMVTSVCDFRMFDPGLIMSDWTDLKHQMHDIIKLPAGVASGHVESLSNGAATPLTHALRPSPESVSSFDPRAPYAAKKSSVIAAAASDVALVRAVTATTVSTAMASVAATLLAREAERITTVRSPAPLPETGSAQVASTPQASRDQPVNAQTTPAGPALTPAQVEQIAGDTRELLQIAIDAVRAAVPVEESHPVVERLKDTAQAIQQLAIKVIDVLPPIVTRTVHAPANLTLIAHLWYGDYRRASELQRLNPQLRNPNFIERGEVLSGFAQ